MTVKRLKRLESEIGAFVKKYQRKAHAGWDPNDRTYDRELEKKIKNLPPEELDILMRGEIDD